MRDHEKMMKIRMLQETLSKEFGINSRADLVRAVRGLEPVDISACVVKPAEAVSFCRDIAKSSIEKEKLLKTQVHAR